MASLTSGLIAYLHRRPVAQTVSYVQYLSVQDDHPRRGVSGSGAVPEVHPYGHQLACSFSMQMPILAHVTPRVLFSDADGNSCEGLR